VSLNNNNNNIYLLQLGCHLVAVVILALVIHHATRTCHIVVCGLPRSTVFLHIIS